MHPPPLMLSSMLHSTFLLSYAMLRLGCRTTQVFISTHSPDFLNACRLGELYCLIKVDGYTKIVRASKLPLIASLYHEGDLLGELWQQGILLQEASKAGGDSL